MSDQIIDDGIQIDEPLGVKEAAAFLKLKPNFIYQLVHFKKLAAYKPGGKKCISGVAILRLTPSETERQRITN